MNNNVQQPAKEFTIKIAPEHLNMLMQALGTLPINPGAQLHGSVVAQLQQQGVQFQGTQQPAPQAPEAL